MVNVYLNCDCEICTSIQSMCNINSVCVSALCFGDINVFMVPTDSKGRRCGMDDDVIDKPVLVFFDLTKCTGNRCNTPQVCRSKCPDTNWHFNPILASVNETYNAMICEEGINVSNKNIEELTKLVESKACAKWYLNSTSVLKRCIPNFSGLLAINDLNDKNITIGKLNISMEVVKFLTSIHSVVNEIVLTKAYILLFISGATLVCLLYIVLLRWIALPCTWITIISVIGILFYLAYLCYNSYVIYEWTGWIVLTCILSGVALIIALLSVCLWKRIDLACQLITETSKATIHMLSIVLFPILPWLLSFLLIIYSVVIALYLISIEHRKFIIKEQAINGNCQCSTDVNYTVGNACEPNLFSQYCHENNESCFSINCLFNDTPTPSYKYYLYAINFVGYLWLFFFIADFKKIVIASTYATWYWTFHKRNIPFFTTIASILRVIKYHLGTIAFGSAIITICRLIRIFIEYLHRVSMQQYDANTVTRTIKNCLFCCAKCFMFIIEKILKFLTKNAYIMCAINGKGLCTSAADALSLILRNAFRAAVLTRIVGWLLRLGKVLITIVMILIAWWYFNSNKDNDEREFWYVPIIVVGLGSYLVATIFFSVYTVGVDTIFLCVLQDCEYHDGSKDKPYYMSRKIGKLLNVY